MLSDICKRLMNRVTGTGSTREEAERIAVFVATGFIMVLEIAGYRFCLSSYDGEPEQQGNHSGYSGICSGTKRSLGSEVENLQPDARRVSPAIFRKRGRTAA